MLNRVVSDPAIRQPIQARIDAANEVAKAFSGSWLGYHSRVYQENLQAAPGARFDAQWGLHKRSLSETRGRWIEYDRDAVKAHIRAKSGFADIADVAAKARETWASFLRIKADVLSIIATELMERDDTFLERLKGDIEQVDCLSERAAMAVFRPSGQFMTADTAAITAGVQTPPHIEILAEAGALSTIFDAVTNSVELVRQAASHLARKDKSKKTQSLVGTNVFLGHGRSLLWRELKDFIEDRLRLPVDEFNRLPVAGVTNTARLSEMMSAAAVAFIIMTAEDETAEGKQQARMNVIHEVGLFQGRLGFTRGIVMLEDGCEEFSNIQGLGQIRFPKGRISAAFEEVRLVLEREGLLVST